MVEELSSIIGFFVESSVFLMLGVILRYNYLKGQSQTFHELLWTVTKSLCFSTLLILTRYVLQIGASHSLLNDMWEKEKYTGREILSYIATSKYSVFSAVIYLTGYSSDLVSSPSRFFLVSGFITSTEILEYIVRTRLREDNKIFSKKTVFDYSLKLRVVRDCVVETFDRWELMKRQSWNLQINSHSLSVGVGLAEDHARAEELLG